MVFVSYSHDSPEHAERVLDFAEALRDDGIDAELGPIREPSERRLAPLDDKAHPRIGLRADDLY